MLDIREDFEPVLVVNKPIAIIDVSEERIEAVTGQEVDLDCMLGTAVHALANDDFLRGA